MVQPIVVQEAARAAAVMIEFEMLEWAAASGARRSLAFPTSHLPHWPVLFIRLVGILSFVSAESLSGSCLSCWNAVQEPYSIMA